MRSLNWSLYKKPESAMGIFQYSPAFNTHYNIVWSHTGKSVYQPFNTWLQPHRYMFYWHGTYNRVVDGQKGYFIIGPLKEDDCDKIYLRWKYKKWKLQDLIFWLTISIFYYMILTDRTTPWKIILHFTGKCWQ